MNAMRNVAGLATSPDQMLARIAQYTRGGKTQIAGVHFYSFGGALADGPLAARGRRRTLRDRIPTATHSPSECLSRAAPGRSILRDAGPAVPAPRTSAVQVLPGPVHEGISQGAAGAQRGSRGARLCRGGVAARAGRSAPGGRVPVAGLGDPSAAGGTDAGFPAGAGARLVLRMDAGGPRGRRSRATRVRDPAAHATKARPRDRRAGLRRARIPRRDVGLAEAGYRTRAGAAGDDRDPGGAALQAAPRRDARRGARARHDRYADRAPEQHRGGDGPAVELGAPLRRARAGCARGRARARGGLGARRQHPADGRSAARYGAAAQRGGRKSALVRRSSTSRRTTCSRCRTRSLAA